jgi:hypothetical protein
VTPVAAAINPLLVDAAPPAQVPSTPVLDLAPLTTGEQTRAPRVEPAGHTALTDGAAASVVATVAQAPVGAPMGLPTLVPTEPVVLLTPPAGASSHGAPSAPTAVSDAPTGPRAAALASSILAAFGAAALPSAPAVDLGSTPD